MLPVIIPVYRKPEQVEKCLAALLAQTVQNAPYLHDNNVENIGFTRALNVGLRRAIRAGEQYAVVLNQDCYLRPDALEKMLAFMESHSRCAIGGIKQISSADPDYILHGGGAAIFPSGKHVTGSVSKGDCAASAPMPWVNGACMIARLDAVLDFGLLDENMFLIGSDSDWCFSARLRGYEVWYIADAVAVHDTGVSVAPSDEMMKLMVKDMTCFRDKWIGSMAYARLSKV